jgi:colicin import membrane protein
MERNVMRRELLLEENEQLEITREDLLNELKVSYINQIASRVKEEWRYQGAKENWSCDTHILQDVNGNVQSVNLQSCNIDDSKKAISFKNSIERAVYKASPLPTAPDASVFDREILFHFRVN